jgi:hypothetical protein
VIDSFRNAMLACLAELAALDVDDALAALDVDDALAALDVVEAAAAELEAELELELLPQPAAIAASASPIASKAGRDGVCTGLLLIDLLPQNGISCLPGVG